MRAKGPQVSLKVLPCLSKIWEYYHQTINQKWKRTYVPLQLWVRAVEFSRPRGGGGNAPTPPRTRLHTSYLGKAKCAGAYVRFKGVNSKLLGTPARFFLIFFGPRPNALGHKKI